MQLEFLDIFSKRYSNIIRPVVAELVHADRRTDGQPDMIKLTVAFSSFANASTNHCTEENLIRALITLNVYKCSFSLFEVAL